MVFCDRCNVCVHQACYGLLEVPEDEWYCDPCKEHLDDESWDIQESIDCAFCPVKGGAFKRLSSDQAPSQWCHVMCALWIPEVVFSNADKMETITIAKPLNQRQKLICNQCKIRKGAPIQCYYDKCVTPFHVTCALLKGLEMRNRINPNDGSSTLEAYCRRHEKFAFIKSPSEELFVVSTAKLAAK